MKWAIYKPWKGFSVIGLGIAADITHFTPLRIDHGSGVPTLCGFILAWLWSVYGPTERET